MAKYELDRDRLNEKTTAEFMGQQVEVRKVIPFKEKEQMATEILAATTVFDEESGLAYRTYMFEPVFMATALAHYAGIEISPEDAPDVRAVAYMNHDGFSPYIGGEDEKKVREMVDDMNFAVTSTFEATHSLQGKIKKLLGATLGDEDLTETIAKSSTVNRLLIDLMGKAGQEKSPANAGKAQMINFAKKKPKK